MVISWNTLRVYARFFLQGRELSGAEIQKTVPHIARPILFMGEKYINKPTEILNRHFACLPWNRVEQVAQSFHSPRFLGTQV